MRAARCQSTRMMRATAIVSPALIFAMISGCAPRVGGERSTIATFPRYRTYAWAGPAAPVLAPSESGAALLDWRIHTAIDRALAARGYERTSGTASLLVDYDVVAPAGSDPAFRAYFRGRHSGAEDLGDMVRGFRPGSLVVYLVDARTRELAYRAWSFDLIDDDASPRRVDGAVEHMFRTLPPVMSPDANRSPVRTFFARLSPSASPWNRSRDDTPGV